MTHFPLQEIINGVVDAIKPELDALREAISDARAPAIRKRKEGPTCKGLTASGKPCSNGCADGTEFCRMHSVERQQRKKKVPTQEPAVKKEPKEKKVLPEHSHAPLETDPDCVPCQVHGDVLTERVVENFQTSPGLDERLKEILSSCPELTQEPVD
ncbi:hypothetical protein DSLPV1_214 [Dishui lake phycodnavirus 1]|uniref:hypothetical protein n=1 Tax=Dishui lake phycodnavirus 1 TaxID=2079134 RepID=UPI000CD6AD94|nr:hypothetical protein C5Y57_gp184 [Dishui lake phycodnavirus 1]AUT19185.1 hypothetical protein DSLPV1_214 [Dishui lake phycodnavirus 1]